MTSQQIHRIWSFIFFSCLAGFIVLSACQHQKPPMAPPAEEYRTWNLTTTIELNYPVPGHLEHFRKIYINAVGYGVQPIEEGDQRTYNYPEGTIIVKEVYTDLSAPQPGEEPIMLDVMIKAPQHPAAQRGWLWVLKNMETREESLIDHKFCCDCHANANEPHPYGDQNPTGSNRDYVFFPPEHTLMQSPSPPKPSRYPYPSGSSF